MPYAPAPKSGMMLICHLECRLSLAKSSCAAEPSRQWIMQPSPAGYGFYSSNIWLYKIVGARFLEKEVSDENGSRHP